MSLVRILVPVIGLAVGLGAGAGAGFYLKGSGKPEDPKDAEAGAEEAPQEVHEERSGVTDFAELTNQFVVPVVRGGSVRALVVLSITLEVAQGASETVFSIEPRLRDAFLQVLFEHSNMGGFDDNFTQTERLSLLRQGLREAASRLLGPDVRDVLIVDIVRQET